MKKILFLGLAVAIAYFVFFDSDFNKDFYFMGEKYTHVKQKSSGEVLYHNYTTDGSGIEYASTFIQIFELSDKIQKSYWSSYLKPVLSRYKLKPTKNERFEFTGNSEIAGRFLSSFAAPLSVGGHDHLAVFVIAGKKVISVSEKKEILNQLKNIKLGI